MGLSEMVLFAIVAAVGAMTYWPFAHQGSGVRRSTVGVIPMIAAALGSVVTSVRVGVARRPVGAPTTRWFVKSSTPRVTQVRCMK
jgi:hypothetical protein